MLFVELDNLTQLSGLFAVLTVSISWMYGLIVLFKAIKLKKKVLFHFYFAIIFIMSPWYPSALGYIYWLITNEEIVYSVYVLIGTIGTPLALYAWLQIYMPALHKNQKGKAVWIIICLSIVFYIYLTVFLFLAPDAPVEGLIGIKRSAIDIDYKGFVLVFLAFSLLVSTITGNDFSIASLKIKDNPVTRWKGRFLILSFNLFAIGAIGDGFLPLTPPTLIIFRLFLMLSSTFYYLGFMLPKWLRKLLKLEAE
ncbi:hypothetical protein LCGC14_1989510 [marine sediment metagenome]|uniref:Histidine kinase N-terminal 7TM region domain-containing protein n=1 Tax=marine sediment metagenome TaxID=412755 RepID=A0A0F9F6Q3_9ZZZZ|nr:hypothetical protein [archaeon]